MDARQSRARLVSRVAGDRCALRLRTHQCRACKENEKQTAKASPHRSTSTLRSNYLECSDPYPVGFTLRWGKDNRPCPTLHHPPPSSSPRVTAMRSCRYKLYVILG